MPWEERLLASHRSMRSKRPRIFFLCCIQKGEERENCHPVAAAGAVGWGASPHASRGHADHARVPLAFCRHGYRERGLPAKWVILPEPWDHCLVPGWCYVGSGIWPLLCSWLFLTEMLLGACVSVGVVALGDKRPANSAAWWLGTRSRDTGGPVRWCW